jgi:hypothetical protein
VNKNKKKIIKLVFIGFIFYIISNRTVFAFDNAPDGPNSETPDKRKYYNFIATPDSTGIFKKSHYSTHDWIADAALRLLIDETDGSLQDWAWLLDQETSLKSVVNWESKYGDGVRHYPVRSYISYLYGTQMPDMNPKKANNARPHRHPTIIDCWWEEGEIIGNGQGMGKWVGRSDYQDFHWIAIAVGPNQYTFVPKGLMRAPEYAWRSSKEAIRCLVPETEGDRGWAKPESAASWLGVMSHYIADLASPPHLIQENEGYYPKAPKFHDWFENQVAKFTTWDYSIGGPKGYQTGIHFFNINMALIGFDAQNIVPLPPYLAALACATMSIEKCYGHLDEGGLFIRNGDLVQQDLITYSSSSYWNWGDPGKDRRSDKEILSSGLTYRQYYDKVEYLLNLAIYYTAAALKWVMVEVKNRNNGKSLDCDQWAKEFYKEKYPEEQRPVENPSGLELDDVLNLIRDYIKKYKPNIVVQFAMLAPTIAFTFIPMIISVIFSVY